MPCQYTDLGQFVGCDPVDLSGTAEGPLNLLYLQTNRTCNYATGNFGILQVGEYYFSFGGVDYKFEVI